MNPLLKLCGSLWAVAAIAGCSGSEDAPASVPAESPAASSAAASAGSTQAPIQEGPVDRDPASPDDKKAGTAGERSGKPEAVTYPMVKSEGLEEGDPERAVALFLEAWQREDWAKMLASTLHSWREDVKDPEAQLRTWFDTSDLRGASIEGLAIRGYEGQVECTVHYTAGSSVETRTVSLRIVHEDPTGRRWKGGTWGVDPALAYQEVR